MALFSTFRSVVVHSVAAALVLMPSAPAFAQTNVVRVPAGTAVTLATTSTLDPQMVRVGDVVNLTVVSDVVVNGKVVFKAGSPARAEITAASPRGIVGRPDKMTVQLQNAQAVDGSTVPITAAKSVEGDDKMVLTIVLTLVCVPFILMKGGKAAIPSGSQINATTNGLSEIKA